MAEGKAQVLQSATYHFLDRGMDTELPLRAMTPNSEGPLFRRLENLTAHGGSLASWFGIFPVAQFADASSFPTIERDGTWFATTPNGVLNGQCPIWSFWDYPMTWNISSSTTQSAFGGFMGILITSREIFHYSPQDQTWRNATPTYSTGTVTINNGQTALVGAGTAWSTRKIARGQLVQLPATTGNWYSIASVNSDTSITLQQAYSGTNLAGANYSIRRCFGGRNYSHGDNLLYATVFNGDLYVGGRTLAGYSNGPAVIRVKNIYDNTLIVEYLLANADLTGAMSPQSVRADLWDIKGLQVLQDGRVVVAASIVPTNKTGIVGNRILYSSNIDTQTHTAAQIWNASPAGFLDIVGIPGEVTALGMLDPNTLTAHFHRGIATLSYTSQYDPPLSASVSAARSGALAPRTVLTHAGREMFLGSDGLVHSFDGRQTTPICNETVTLFHADEENTQTSYWTGNAHASFDARRQQYRLWMPDNNFEEVVAPPGSYENYESNTYCWCIPLGNVGVFYETYAAQITMCSGPVIGAKESVQGGYFPQTVGGNVGLMVVGVPSTDASGGKTLGGEFIPGLIGDNYSTDGSPRAAGLRIYSLSNNPYADDAITLSFETDDLDFGLPAIDKTISHVLIWFDGQDGESTNQPTVEAISRQGTIVGVAGESSFAPTVDTPIMFDFKPTAAESWRIRLTRTSPTPISPEGNGFGLLCRRMTVYYQPQGEIETVDPSL